MTLDEYEQLPSEEKEHFAMCAECGEVFAPPGYSLLRLDKAGLG
jgi:uncharacterized OB-fold protein